MMSSERDDTLFELEQKLAQVGRRVSAEEAAALIADDFVEFGASGRAWSKAEIIAAMTEWDPIDRRVENFTARKLSPSVCLVTYKSVGPTKNSQPRPCSLRTSIWRHTGERWQIVFHQGTSA